VKITAELIFAVIGAWFVISVAAGAAWVIIAAMTRRGWL
jgi:hypothetical protein